MNWSQMVRLSVASLLSTTALHAQQTPSSADSVPANTPPPVTRHFLFSGPRTMPRASPEVCARLTTPDAQRLSVDAYRAAVRRLAWCPNEGGEILSKLWRVRPIAQLGVLAYVSSSLPSHVILQAVTEVVRDASQPDSVRMAAINVMIGYARPGYSIRINPDTAVQMGFPESVRNTVTGWTSRVIFVGTDHPPADSVLPGAEAEVRAAFQTVATTPPGTRTLFGKICAVLVKWMDNVPPPRKPTTN